MQFKTVVDMVAFPIPTVNNRLSAIVTGRLSANDGYGGTFYFDSSSSVTNGGIFHKGGFGRWVRQFSGPANFGWWGAAMDGTTDDTSKLQDFVSYGCTNGTELFIPPRSVLISSTITAPVNTLYLSLKGAGRDSTILICHVNGASAIDIGSSTWTELSGFGMSGNGSSGHALRLVDPTFESGTYSPQLANIHDLNIQGFQGNDVDQNGVAMPACGIFGVNALGCTFKKIFIAHEPVGIYLYKCYQPLVEDISFDTISQINLLSQANESATYAHLDIVGGRATAGTFNNLVAVNLFDGTKNIDMGGFVCVDDLHTVLRDSKLKNQYNQIVLQTENPPLIANNFIVDDVQDGILSYGPFETQGNTFYPFFVAGTQTRKVIHIVQNRARSNHFGPIAGDSFLYGGGGEFDAFVWVESTNTSYPTRGVIRDANIGGAVATANPTYVRSIVKTVGVTDGIQVDNSPPRIPANVTIGSLWNFTNVFGGTGYLVTRSDPVLDGGNYTNLFGIPNAAFPAFANIQNVAGFRWGWTISDPTGSTNADLVYLTPSTNLSQPMGYWRDTSSVGGTTWYPFGLQNTINNQLPVPFNKGLAQTASATWDGSILRYSNTVYQLDNNKWLQGLNNANVGYFLIGVSTLNHVLVGNPSVFLDLQGVNEYADQATAIAAGARTNTVYRTGDVLKIVHP